MGEGMGMDMLPEDSVSTILSYTSPSDACRSSMVSSTFLSAAESDGVWERFLPNDYEDVVSRLVTPLTFTKKKELFLLLCNPVLIDAGKKSFKLEKPSGKKSYMLSARELSITWSDEPLYWSWRSIPESRFSEVAELRTTNWLEIHGRIKTQNLSPNTTYGAYLVLKIYDRAYGLDSIPSEISVSVGDKICNGTAYLRQGDRKKQQMESLFYMNRVEMLRKRVGEGDGREVPRERDDGWMEIELGEFFSGEDSEEVKMSLMEVKGYQLKGGLVIEGIEVRPKDQ
ncbi:F-box protein PP2-B15-like [Juglans microcarpa x Juglans regia]|uniref:F-box protein PP2-B15-like n=1 Tax=Juglans microcarpa x Juglans regia TaxID=2249226 RepID=UPI001B7EF119|nr:F-box protein PP2-B15-like [Juglans microcarpa x Juglans regia]